MAWDFETEPEFEEKLAWMRQFMVEEIYPIETLELEWEQLSRLVKPLQEEAKARGLWAAHLDPELGGQGFGQLKLGLMHEILGMSPFGPLVFGNNAPDSGNAELLALGIKQSGADWQAERWLRFSSVEQKWRTAWSTRFSKVALPAAVAMFRSET